MAKNFEIYKAVLLISLTLLITETVLNVQGTRLKKTKEHLSRHSFKHHGQGHGVQIRQEELAAEEIHHLAHEVELVKEELERLVRETARLGKLASGDYIEDKDRKHIKHVVHPHRGKDGTLLPGHPEGEPHSGDGENKDHKDFIKGKNNKHIKHVVHPHRGKDGTLLPGHPEGEPHSGDGENKDHKDFIKGKNNKHIKHVVHPHRGKDGSLLPGHPEGEPHSGDGENKDHKDFIKGKNNKHIKHVVHPHRGKDGSLLPGHPEGEPHSGDGENKEDHGDYIEDKNNKHTKHVVHPHRGKDGTLLPGHPEGEPHSGDGENKEDHGDYIEDKNNKHMKHVVHPHRGKDGTLLPGHPEGDPHSGDGEHKKDHGGFDREHDEKSDKGHEKKGCDDEDEECGMSGSGHEEERLQHHKAAHHDNQGHHLHYKDEDSHQKHISDHHKHYDDQSRDDSTENHLGSHGDENERHHSFEVDSGGETWESHSAKHVFHLHEDFGADHFNGKEGAQSAVGVGKLKSSVPKNIGNNVKHRTGHLGRHDNKRNRIINLTKKKHHREETKRDLHNGRNAEHGASKGAHSGHLHGKKTLKTNNVTKKKQHVHKPDGPKGRRKRDVDHARDRVLDAVTQQTKPVTRDKVADFPGRHGDTDFSIDDTKAKTGQKKLLQVNLARDFEIEDETPVREEEQVYKAQILETESRRSKRAVDTMKERRNTNIQSPAEVQSKNSALPSRDLNCGSLKNGALSYDKTVCRLCQCVNGQLMCEPKPPGCRDDKRANMCYVGNGEAFSEGAMHYDGCNNCVCRKREWVCTRLRCRSAHYNYTDYGRLLGHKDGVTRPVDTCLECDREPVTPVCGPDWVTYRSLCHARFCGNYDIDEIQQGPCNKIDPCQDSDCGDQKVCVPFPRGPCLIAKTRDGSLDKKCKQYQCISVDIDCPEDNLPKEMVCGEDGVTYPSECHLVKHSASFAYRGACREKCQQGNAQVCGTDGVTLQSVCHANLFYRHVDYPGACEVMPAKPEVIKKGGVSVFLNRRCSKVAEMARCYFPKCTATVVPEGACCPVCGSALIIRLDRAVASDLVAFSTLRPSVEFDRFETIQKFLRRIQDPEHLQKCRMTVDLTDRKDVSVLFIPRHVSYLPSCEQAVQHTVDYVNTHSFSSQPLEALMAAAVAVEVRHTNQEDPTKEEPRNDGGTAAHRVRRMEHGLLHRSFNSKQPAPSNGASSRTPFMNQIVKLIVFFGLYWVVTH